MICGIAVMWMSGIGFQCRSQKDNTKGNVILVTTRFPALAQIVKTPASDWKDLKGLDPESFKELFRAYAFGDNQSRQDHNELLDTGDEIVKKLKGSPLLEDY